MGAPSAGIRAPASQRKRNRDEERIRLRPAAGTLAFRRLPVHPRLVRVEVRYGGGPSAGRRGAAAEGKAGGGGRRGDERRDTRIDRGWDRGNRTSAGHAARRAAGGPGGRAAED